MSSHQNHSHKPKIFTATIQQRGIYRRKRMDCCEAESKIIPTLPLFKPPPMHSPERPGMLTPPLQTSAASVPFGWEDEPGKPKPCTDIVSFSNSTPEFLDLPPRLLVDAINISKIPSPNTVLGGPCMAEDFCAERGQLGSLVLNEKNWFGSWREEAFKVKHVFPSSADKDADHVGGGHKNLRMRKMKHYGSCTNPFHTKSRVWETICEGWKQVIPWRGEKLKKYGCGWL